MSLIVDYFSSLIFYAMNYLITDDRAILFEKERLRLRKGIQNFHQTAKDNRSVASEAMSVTSEQRSVSKYRNFSSDRSFHSQHAAADEHSQPPPQQQQQQQNSAAPPPPPKIKHVMGTAKQSQLPSGTNRSILSISSSSKRASPTNKSTIPTGATQTGTIYSWEDSAARPPREPLFIDGVQFEPTDAKGFYRRMLSVVPESEPANDEEYFQLQQQAEKQADFTLSDKFVDFQIALTQEEFMTLAARRKAERVDVKLHRNQASAKSVHSSTPYIEQRRIVKQLYRPANPDKWVDPAGIRAYKRVDRMF